MEDELVQIVVWMMGIMAIYYLLFYLYYSYVNKFRAVSQKIEQPPDGMSPALLRYIWIGEYDATCLLAAIISAGSKRPYQLFWYPKRFVARLKDWRKKDELSEDELAVLTYSNKRPVKTINFENQRDQFTDRAEERLLNYLDDKHGHLLAKRHTYHVRGLLFSVFMFTFFFLPFTGFNFIELILFGALHALIVIGFQWLLDGLLSKWDWFLGFRDLLIVGFGGGLLFFCDMMVEPKIWSMLYFLPILGVTTLGYILMPKRTRAGAKLWYKVNAYRKYLIEKSAEELYTRDDTILAYHVALDVNTSSTEVFDSLLSVQQASDFDSIQYQEFIYP